MHKAYCQSVVGLKKSFDAEIGDVVTQVKATIRFKCSVAEAGVYHEKDVIILTPAEYEALTGGHNIAVPYKFIEGLKTIRSVIDDAIAEAEGVKSEP